jgi:hypothetical protein
MVWYETVPQNRQIGSLASASLRLSAISSVYHSRRKRESESEQRSPAIMGKALGQVEEVMINVIDRPQTLAEEAACL